MFLSDPPDITSKVTDILIQVQLTFYLYWDQLFLIRVFEQHGINIFKKKADAKWRNKVVTDILTEFANENIHFTFNGVTLVGRVFFRQNVCATCHYMYICT